MALSFKRDQARLDSEIRTTFFGTLLRTERLFSTIDVQYMAKRPYDGGSEGTHFSDSRDTYIRSALAGPFDKPTILATMEKLSAIIGKPAFVSSFEASELGWPAGTRIGYNYTFGGRENSLYVDIYPDSVEVKTGEFHGWDVHDENSASAMLELTMRTLSAKPDKS